MKIFINILVPISVLATLLTGCAGPAGKDIRDYYFPLKSLTEGMVYEYRPAQGDSLSPVYWYYRSFLQPGQVILSGTYYEYELIPLQTVREEMVGNGMLLLDLALLSPDTSGAPQARVNAEVLAGNVFPFQVGDTSSIYLYKIRFDFPDTPGRSTTVIKNRRYVGTDSFSFQGKNYDCVRFEVRELIEDEDPEAGTMEPRTDGFELYARGIGLVYYEKQLGKDKIAYRLHDRYPMEQLETRFREQYGE